MADLTVKEVTKIVEGPNIEKSKLAIKKLKEMEKEAVKKLRKTTKGTTTIDLGKNIKPRNPFFTNKGGFRKPVNERMKAHKKGIYQLIAKHLKK